MKTNKKSKFIISLCAVIFTLSVSNTSVAGWKDLKDSIKSEKNKVKNKAKKGNKTGFATSHGSASPKGVSYLDEKHASTSKPNPELRSSILKCDDVALTNVQVGNVTSYKVTEGLSSRDFTGFINRRPASVSNTCFVGVLQSDECVTMDVSEAELDKVSGGTSNNLKMQCVYSDDPSKMATAEVPYKADYVSLKSMLLKCGHDQGDGYACDDGSNSSRAGKYKKEHLKGKVQLSVCATSYHQVPKGGQHIYCQYYNTKSKKSIFGFEFDQKTN